MELIKYYYVNKKTGERVKTNKPFDTEFLKEHEVIKEVEHLGEITEEQAKEILLQRAIAQGDLILINKD